MTLLDLLKARNMTQKDLSKRTGITEATISRYINQKREMRVNNAIKIAQALDMSIGEFIVIYLGKDLGKI